MAKKLTREQLIKLLAIEIAEEHFEVNQDIYEEESDAYANDGVTEAMYMAGSGEHIRPAIEESIGPDLGDQACKEYERLVRKAYPRIKKSDFCW
jgi:hypothetical protein